MTSFTAYPMNREGTMTQETQRMQRAADRHPATLVDLRAVIREAGREPYSDYVLTTDAKAYLAHHGFRDVGDIRKPLDACNCLLALTWCKAWGKPMSDYLAIPLVDQNTC